MANATRVGRIHELREETRGLPGRDKMGRLLTSIRKFAVDSAVKDSRQFFAGKKKVQQIVQKGSKEQPLLFSWRNKEKPDGLRLAEEMQAKIEETHGDMNKLKQDSKTATKLIDESDPPKKTSNEGFKASDLLKTKEKRIFIHSRL